MSNQELINALLAPVMELIGVKTDSEISVNEQRISESLFPWRIKGTSTK